MALRLTDTTVVKSIIRYKFKDETGKETYLNCQQGLNYKQLDNIKTKGYIDNNGLLQLKEA